MIIGRNIMEEYVSVIGTMRRTARSALQRNTNNFVHFC